MCDICQVGLAANTSPTTAQHPYICMCHAAALLCTVRSQDAVMQSLIILQAKYLLQGCALAACATITYTYAEPDLSIVYRQDAPAVLFCCEDRAVICRECDLMIHTANEFTAKHNR